MDVILRGESAGCPTVFPMREPCPANLVLVPKLCLGTHWCEALLRVRFQRSPTGSRASKTCVPKQSLGTRSREEPRGAARSQGAEKPATRLMLANRAVRGT